MNVSLQECDLHAENLSHMREDANVNVHTDDDRSNLHDMRNIHCDTAVLGMPYL